MPTPRTRTSTWAMRAVSRSRRSALERERRALDPLLERFFRSPNLGWAVGITTLFVLVCTALSIWARAQPLVAIGRVANTTVLARVPFSVADPLATEKDQSAARQQTPRVYVANVSALETLRASIENLPKTLSAVERMDQLAPEVAKQFRLTDAGLKAIRDQISGNEVSATWRTCAMRLLDELKSRALVDDRTAQRQSSESVSKDIELRVGAEPPRTVRWIDSLINIRDERELTEAMTGAAREAGFTEPALTVVVSRLTTNPEPTFEFDEAATIERQNERASRIAPRVIPVSVGQVIFRAGDTVTPQSLGLYEAELAAFSRTADREKVWLRWLSVLGAVGAIGMATAGYLALFCPRVKQSPGRMAGIAGLMAGSLAIAVIASVANPTLLMLTAVAPTVFVAVILVVAYDQRVSLALGTLHGVLTCIALAQPIGVYALMLTGISFAVIQLREIRDRRTIVRMGGTTGLALAVGTVLVALIDRPITDDSLRETLTDALLAGLGGVGIGVITLALLPTIERVFGVTTGMTLIELRDPKQPMLRQLQQRAPGTYNHSLNVASIAEAAAESINANSLLTYVGALYHDVGKMNKPEYFVENQAGGPNKHEKLSPAMSLLVIVGHVKDGMALAEEHKLPRVLRHFIEAHHGTTLVEFFYQRARQQAEKQSQSGKPGDDADIPDEIEYRYPGPKPRTKEVAILMLADAVESATRTLAEPTPSRIEALVRAIANKRLMDGQFEECELTLRELQTITDSIAKTVASIYHGRVVYQSTASLTQTSALRDTAPTIVETGPREERRA